MSINVTPDKELLENSDMIIVDIRTPGEWAQTGVVPGCKTIMFFDERGGYDAEVFLKQIDELGGKDVEIGLICRTGARTAQIAGFMEQQGYNVKNLLGGVMQLTREGYKLSSYQP